MNWLCRTGFSSFFRGIAAAAVVLGSALPVRANPVTPPSWTQWTGISSAAWATASNWETNLSTQVAPTATLDAILPGTVPPTATIDLGSGAVAKSLLVDNVGYALQNGDLTLANELWIQQTGGAGLTIATSGTVSTLNTTLGYDAGKSGSLVVLGSVTTGGAVVGRGGSSSLLKVGDSSITTSGTFTATGADVVIGALAGAANNTISVSSAGSQFTAAANVIVGQAGSSNAFEVKSGAAASAAGVRLGIDAGSTGNTLTVDGAGSTLGTSSQAVYVGFAGSGNTFAITGGGVVTIGGTNKNFYVGSGTTSAAATASNNSLVVSGAGSKLVMAGNNADLVVSGTNGQTGNVVQVVDGGLLDVNRTIVGSGGTLTGNGTVNGPVLVGTGGVVAPGGAGGAETIGTLTLAGSLDLSPSLLPGQHGRLDIDINGSQIDQISVSGILNIAGATLHFDTTNWDGLTHVFATYGTLGGTFGTVEGLPAGTYLDYVFNGNQIALVVPEIDPASLGSVLALVAGAFGVLERRRKRA